MHLLIAWEYGYKSEGFKRLINDLNVSFLTYITGSDSSSILDFGIPSRKFYILDQTKKYMEDEKDMLPIDAELLEKMQPYEVIAKHIINRWRRSVVKNDTYSENHHVYTILLRFWNDYIRKNKVSLVILCTQPHIPMTYMIYALARVYNIPIITQDYLPMIFSNKYVYFLKTSIENKDFHFVERLNHNLELVRETSNVELSSILEEYISNYSKPPEAVKRAFADTTRTTIKEYIDRVRFYLSQRRYSNLFRKSIYELKKRHERKYITQYEEIKSIIPSYSNPFYFFPLHMQPECTTLPGGGVYFDQLLIIRMLANALPDGTELYVKEHPGYWLRSFQPDSIGEARSREFYDEICSYQNVKLIRHDFSSLELIQQCKALVTVTGTAGAEALFKHKPVIIFGNQFYSDFKGAFRVKTYNDCINAVNTIETENVVPTENELRASLKTLEPIIATLEVNSKDIVWKDCWIQDVNQGSLMQYVEKLVNFYKENYTILEGKE